MKTVPAGEQTALRQGVGGADALQDALPAPGGLLVDLPGPSAQLGGELHGFLHAHAAGGGHGHGGGKPGHGHLAQDPPAAEGPLDPPGKPLPQGGDQSHHDGDDRQNGHGDGKPRADLGQGLARVHHPGGHGTHLGPQLGKDPVEDREDLGGQQDHHGDHHHQQDHRHGNGAADVRLHPKAALIKTGEGQKRVLQLPCPLREIDHIGHVVREGTAVPQRLGQRFSVLGALTQVVQPGHGLRVGLVLLQETKALADGDARPDQPVELFTEYRQVLLRHTRLLQCLFPRINRDTLRCNDCRCQCTP